MSENSLIIRVYGDSRSKSRYGDNLQISGVWYEQLKTLLEERLNKKIYLCDKSFGGYTIKQIKKLYDNDSSYWADSNGIVLIFLGIVDCAPRPLPTWARFLLSKLNKRLRMPIVNFLHNHRTEILKIKYYNETSLKTYKKYYTKMVTQACQNNEVFCIGIGPVGESFLARAYGFKKEADIYDDFMKSLSEQFENCHFIDLTRLLADKIEENKNTDEEIFIGDGHHFTELGNKYIAEIVYDHIINANAIRIPSRNAGIEA